MGTDKQQTLENMSHNAIPKDFLKNVMQNGVGRYVCQLKRITLRFCKESHGSRPMRDFVENHLLEFSEKHPGVVVYMQPRRHRAPSIAAEFLNGRREVKDLSGKETDEICQWIEHQRTRSGVEIVRHVQPHHTDSPSTQGIWHPFMFRDTETAVAKFPCKELSEIKNVGRTATDFIREERLHISPADDDKS